MVANVRPELPYDRNVARRVQVERERHGLSYEALARAVSDTGCRMNPSTPFKIEKGDPPRRITIDELVAFAKVFGLTLDEMVAPLEAADDTETAELVERVSVMLRETGPSLKALRTVLEQLVERVGDKDRADRLLTASTGEPVWPALFSPYRNLADSRARNLKE